MFVDLFHIDDAFRCYITRRLFPQLSCTASDCSIECPMVGEKTCIRLVRGLPENDFIIRAYPKSARREAYQLFLADDLLRKNNIPAPRLVDYAENFSPKGVTFITEECLVGEIWGVVKPDEHLARLLGELLARLHSVKSDYWGPLIRSEASHGSYGASQLKKVNNRLHGANKFAPDKVGRKETRAVKTWFVSFKYLLDGIRNFNLIHHKINWGNILYSSSQSRLYFVDFATLCYGFRGKDLARAELELLLGNKDLIRVFLDDYFSHFSPEVREEYDKLSTFYRAYYHLSRSAVYLRRAHNEHMEKHDVKTNYLNQFLNHWQTLRAIITGQ
jgi:aminoglycoside phosphotransferase (APT) family kinase protein